MRLLVRNVRPVDGRGESPLGCVAVEDGRFADAAAFAAGTPAAPAAEVPPARNPVTPAAVTVDGGGALLVPGFVDIHVHGGGGHDLCDGTEEALLGMCEAHLAHGTTTIYPTFVSEERETLARTMALFRTLRESGRFRATVPGLHAEGPFLSPLMCGAQRRDLLLPPTEADIRLAAENADVLRRITCAPEVAGVPAYAAALLPLGISFSMGHTNATYEEAAAAYAAGFSSVTHLYCATSGFHKVGQTVHIGVTQYAYAEPGIAAELIGDGCHIPPELLRLVLAVKGEEKVILVTDAMRAAGTEAKESYLGRIDPRNRVIVEDGVAKLPDRSSFAGSVGTMDRAFRFAVARAGLPLSAAVRLTAENPAALMGIADRKGSLAPGHDADFLLLDPVTYAVRAVYVGGERVCP